MNNARPDLGFGDQLDDFDPSEWSTTKLRKDVRIEATKNAAPKAAQAAGFVSREPMKTKPLKLQRRRRTGRNAQINIKTTPETIEAFCELADRRGWGLGETLENAVELLLARYPAK